MRVGLVIFGCIVGTANVFVFGFMLFHLHAIGPDGAPTTSYDAIVTLLTILAVILGAVAIGLGAAAFFGYQALEGAMLRQTDKLVSERFENQRQAQKPEGTGPPPTPPTQAEEEKTL